MLKWFLQNIKLNLKWVSSPRYCKILRRSRSLGWPSRIMELRDGPRITTEGKETNFETNGAALKNKLPAKRFSVSPSLSGTLTALIPTLL